jgi:hypothetical protein
MIIDTIVMVVFVLCRMLHGGIVVWVDMRYRFLLTLYFVLLLSRGCFLMLIAGLIIVSQACSLQLPCDIEPAAQEIPVQMALQGYPPSV